MLVGLLRSEVVVLIDGLQQLQPCSLPHTEVQEPFYHVELLYSLAVVYQILANLLSRLLGRFLSSPNKRKDH